MKQTSGILLLVVSSLISFGQTENGPKKSFIPSGWTIFQEASGDLNKDSLVDVAIVIENATPDEDGEKARALLILLKNNKTDDTFHQACRADQVILGSQSGGTLGDPFASMEIKRNVLRIDFYGGSREKWGTTHRYWFKGGAFYVIGATYTIETDAVTETYDYNLYIGNIIVTRKDASNKANNKTTTRQHKIIMPELSRFDPDAIWGILMNANTKTSTCVLQGAGLGDCFHLEFDCGDFGNAVTYLDQASQALWDSLTVAAPADDVAPNPDYKGKAFEITYIEKVGVRCEEQGKDKYQLVIGIALKK
jgi:hypothetical protein